MRVVVQRVANAKVTVADEIVGRIDRGLLILLGVGLDDTELDIEWLVHKITNMRIFSDSEGKMNTSITEVNGSFLVVSQFTLQASTKKGNRPSYTKAARPEQAVPLYKRFVELLEVQSGRPVETGVFGADMQVALVNDGPVTIWLDTKNKE